MHSRSKYTWHQTLTKLHSDKTIDNTNAVWPDSTHNKQLFNDYYQDTNLDLGFFVDIWLNWDLRAMISHLSLVSFHPFGHLWFEREGYYVSNVHDTLLSTVLHNCIRDSEGDDDPVLQFDESLVLTEPHWVFLRFHRSMWRWWGFQASNRTVKTPYEAMKSLDLLARSQLLVACPNMNLHRLNCLSGDLCRVTGSLHLSQLVELLHQY